MTVGACIEGLRAAAYRVPTDAPNPEHLESDGTLEWTATDLVVTQVSADGETGLGYTYAHPAAVSIIEDKLLPAVRGRPVDDVRGCWQAMRRCVRNLGATGLVAMAISAVDAAIWDLVGRVTGQPLCVLLGGVHARVPVYGSGGFTSYDDDTLAAQLAGWVDQGIPRVKLKVGRDDTRDHQRLRIARDAVGESTELYVDANGAYLFDEAVSWGRTYRDEFGVTWFEEPISSDDIPGLVALRERLPAGLDLAAGEYSWRLWDVERMLAASAVDCLQIDVTRCQGITGFVDAAALAAAHGVDVSAHCAPQLAAHASTAAPRLRHLEWFHDHVRIESMLFDGVLMPDTNGDLVPDPSRPGHGLTFREDEAQRFRVA